MPTITDAVENLIARTGEEWANLWNQGKVDALTGLFADDAVYMPPHHAAIHGREAIREYLRNPISHHVATDLTYEVTFIKHSGDLAYDVGRYSMMVPDAKGVRRLDRGKYLTVWRRQSDGQWRIAADTWSSDLAPAA